MSDPSTNDLRDGFNAFTEDMAEHQRSVGSEPTPAANQDLAAAEFEKLEKQGAFKRADATPAPPAPEQLELREKRTVNGRDYTLTKDFKHGDVPMLPGRLKEESIKILRRLQMLLRLQETGPLGAPSFRTKAIDVMDALTIRKNHFEFLAKLDALLEESNKYFGDWQVDPAPKVYVGA